MDGYKIVYIDESGIKQKTFMGLPMMSPGLSDVDNETAVHLMFVYAHPGCKICSFTACTLDDFKCK